MALQRPTKRNPLILLQALIDDTLVAAAAGIAQSKIAGLVAALADRASQAGANVFAGANNTFNNPVTIAAGTLAAHAVNLGQLNAATSGVNTAIHAPATDVTALRAMASAALADAELINVASTGALWRWVSTSTAADDGIAVVKPNDIAVGNPGRWIYFLEQAIDVVTKIGDQTVGGIKNFTSSPLVPNATTAFQAVTKGQMDAANTAIQTQVTTNANAIAAIKQLYVVRLPAQAIGTVTLPKGAGPNIPDDDSVQLFVNSAYWGKGASAQFIVTAGGASLTCFALEEISDVEFRYYA